MKFRLKVLNLLTGRAFYPPARRNEGLNGGQDAVLRFIKGDLPQSVPHARPLPASYDMAAHQSATVNGMLGLLAGVPFLFDSVVVGPDGAIAHRDREKLSFCFDFLGVTFNADGQRMADSFVVTLTANLGPLPFSAESAAVRNEIRNLVAASALPEAPEFSIADDQTIRLVSSFELYQPVSPILILTVVTEYLIAVKPWLTRFAELLADPALRKAN
jgi:hypothetical protein